MLADRDQIAIKKLPAKGAIMSSDMDFNDAVEAGVRWIAAAAPWRLPNWHTTPQEASFTIQGFVIASPWGGIALDGGSMDGDWLGHDPILS